jgi:hypothetical protein
VDDDRTSEHAADRTSDLPVVPGQIIGDRYRIGVIIGEGGMGVVCAATHVALGTPVAVKLIRGDLKHDPDSVRRFLQEARTAASLKGEHIARVYDVGQLDSGEPYLVMEQLDGVGLDAFVAARGPLTVDEAVGIVLQACEGLAEAHALALVHRDIKPANLFLARRPDGELTLKILDFGISKRLVDSARKGLTEPGRSLGSPSYMSPEQMLDASLVDQRADVWSLGILLFELLTAETPFGGESVPQVCASVLTAPAPPPSARRPGIDAGLDAVVLRCLEKDPTERYASVAALADALAPFTARPIRTGSLGLAETRPAARWGSRSEGSLVPFLAGQRRPRARWPFWVMVAALLCMLPLVAWLSFSREGKYERLLGSGDAHDWRFPWDPSLNSGPDGEASTPRLEGTRPMALQMITAETSTPGDRARLPKSAGSLGMADTSAEQRLRVERSERWQRDQDLLEVGDEARRTTGDVPGAAEPGQESPNDDP